VTGIAALIAKDFGGVFKPFASTANSENTIVEYPFEDIDTINFFASSAIDGADLKITTGAAFSSAENVAKSTPSSLWCYLSYGGGETHRTGSFVRGPCLSSRGRAEQCGDLRRWRFLDPVTQWHVRSRRDCGIPPSYRHS
jgi:hypothetical protein